ncbi:alkylation response protein AidB-like acyl-CoA dehydrogenase [Humitalea rosea]|uniref:Alkylation response protein AidB-like acyl-CoA dehydrogenase n=1 Tax=Humitalea rosea TaxID=990373 RepID=A0A2W7IGG7_9PROT|nr:acyl-CoA dehydrogenase family protein [Humitalea rosea]PZW45861.1 alkylation response protein AidB-like acyl-CoA dehydrogenase [Humitalea rosea]
MSQQLAEDDRAESIRMIRDSAAAIAPPGGDLKRVRALRFKTPGFDPAVWAEMGALGWTGLRVPEELGGSGLGMGEFCALAEALGAGLAPEPLVPCMLSAMLLSAAATHPTTLIGSGEAGEALAAMLTGEAMVLTAWQERANTLEAPGTPGAARLFLPMAGGATHFLVPVREAAGLALYIQPAAGADLTLEATQDGGSFGTLRPAGGVKILDQCAAVLEQALGEAALGTAATLLGVMDRAFAITLDYLKTRTQFGRPIGAFQSLQHRAADLAMEVALTRASVEAAAASLDAAAPNRGAAIARAKARASDSAMLVTRQAIQLHGGIGYTDEHDIGLYLRRAMVLASLFGGAALHRRAFMTLAPESGDE